MLSWSSFNSLPNDKFQHWFKLKAFADDKLNIAKMMISHFDRVENTVGKVGKRLLPAFSPFPTVFSKAFFWVVKSPDWMVKS